MKRFYRILCIAAIILFTVTETANAQILDGRYTLTQGTSTTIRLADTYIRTLNKASSVSATWSTSSSEISITSQTNTQATIYGVSPSTDARLNYRCSYWIDGFYRTMNFYYEITVKASVIYVTSVQISSSHLTLEIGETYQLSAAVYPANATNRSLRWESDESDIASVSSNGLVTARSAGETQIWVYSRDGSGWSDYCSVFVFDPNPVESIELSDSEKTLTLGEKFTLTATVLPSTASNHEVTWSTDNPNVATVNNGVVSTVGLGSCNITCTSASDSDISAVCRLTVVEPEPCWLSVILPNGSFAINVTDIDPVELSIMPDEGYEIHSITLDGQPLSVEADGTQLTLDKLIHSAELNVVFVDNLATHIESVERGNEPISVSVSHHEVSISALPQGETVYVYSLNGMLVKSTQESHFVLPDNGVYIIRIGSRSYKFAI